MNLVSSRGLVYVQVPYMVSNLIFSYDKQDFVPPVPAVRFGDLRDVAREIASENWGKKMWSTSCFSMSVVNRTPVLPLEEYIFVGLSFLFNVPTEALLIILHIVAKSSIRCALPFLIPSLHTWTAALYSSQGAHPCFHCLCISFLQFNLTRRSLLRHIGLLTP